MTAGLPPIKEDSGLIDTKDENAGDSTPKTADDNLDDDDKTKMLTRKMLTRHWQMIWIHCRKLNQMLKMKQKKILNLKTINIKKAQRKELLLPVIGNNTVADLIWNGEI